MSSLHRPTRAGFTLIELLVVIAIIGVLMGLTTAAVQRVRITGQRAQTVSEINQLNAALTSFKKDNGFYPPNRFVIPMTRNPNDMNAQLLNRMFPRWTLDGSTTAPMPANGGTILTGIQVVVYFLGGPQGTGWATDAPVAPTSSTKKTGSPWFDFPTNKLTNGAFTDPYGTPYGYHSTDGVGNYSLYPGQPFAFFTSGGKPVNQGNVQIVSAGRDKAFGPGGAWNPGSGLYAGAGVGADDLGNFNGGMMLGTQGQ